MRLAIFASVAFLAQLGVILDLNAATNTVKIGDGVRFFFSPTNITITAGDTITWTNAGTVAHDSTELPPSGSALWSSGPLALKANFSFRFTNAGAYPYFCSVHQFTHPEQTGSVSVVAANISPSVSMTNTVNANKFFAPASMTWWATASESGGSISQVEFFRDSASLGVSLTPPYTNTVTGLGAGTFGFSAVATDNQGSKATSSVVTVTVSLPPTISLGSAQRSSNGVFTFRVSGGSFGQTCVIDGCDTLPNWSPLFTNTFPNTTCPACPFIDFTDSVTNRNQHFYRARVSP